MEIKIMKTNTYNNINEFVETFFQLTLRNVDEYIGMFEDDFYDISSSIGRDTMTNNIDDVEIDDVEIDDDDLTKSIDRMKFEFLLKHDETQFVTIDTNYFAYVIVHNKKYEYEFAYRIAY